MPTASALYPSNASVSDPVRLVRVLWMLASDAAPLALLVVGNVTSVLMNHFRLSRTPPSNIT